MRKRHNAFTLAEMLVVMGIIILFIAMAVPAVRALTGSSSISVARNQLTALITRAREEAVGIQDVRGVLFILDPASNRVMGYICQAATVQDPDPSTSSMVMLDLVPSRDALALPPGVRLQMMFNGVNDHYLGYNPLTTSGNPPLIGGVILFDGNGRLIVRQYGFQMNQTIASGAFGLSNLGLALNNMYPAGNLTYTSGTTKDAGANSYAFVPTITTATTGYPNTPFYPTGTFTNAPYSQLGLVLFDYDAFKSAGFGDQDADITGKSYSGTPTGQTQSEQVEEAWIDSHSTPVLVNRYNGTLIRGE